MPTQPDARKAVYPRRNARLEYRPDRRQVTKPGDEPTAALDAKDASPDAVEASPDTRGSAPDAEASVTLIAPRSPSPMSQSKNEEPESRCPHCA